MSLIDINSDDTATRLHGYARLLATPLYVPLLPGQGPDDGPRPRVFDSADGPMVLGFLSVESMAAFSAEITDYALLPGAELADAMAGTSLALGLEFGAANAVQLSPASLVWLSENAVHLPPAAAFTPEPGPDDAASEETGEAVPPILRNLRPYQ